MTLLVSKNIVVDRGGSNRFAYPDLQLKEKDRLLLTGPSGCGKTTLLSIIAGLLPPTQGTIEFQGTDLYALDGKTRDRLRGRKMGFVFQTLHLLPSLTLRQNIALASAMSGTVTDERRLDDLLTELSLSERADAKPGELSQGEQQRAAIARAVVNRPAIIVADEPTSALDRDNAHKVIELLQWQADQSGAALLVVTHDDRIMDKFSNIVSLRDVRKAEAA